MNTPPDDLELARFAAEGAAPLPEPVRSGFVEHRGASLWYATYGQGTPVVMLHGGLGKSLDWGNQVSVLVETGFEVILLDTRGHGRSTRDAQPFSYQLLASDVEAVLDTLGLVSAHFVGWSDGACTALVLAHDRPTRVRSVVFFACNVDPSGTHDEFHFGPLMERCYHRHVLDYQKLSPAPDGFADLQRDLEVMQRNQPNYTADDLRSIQVPVHVVQGEHDEFIRKEHAEYLADTLTQGRLTILEGVGHFAPIQRAGTFNEVLLGAMTFSRGPVET